MAASFAAQPETVPYSNPSPRASGSTVSGWAGNGHKSCCLWRGGLKRAKRKPELEDIRWTWKRLGRAHLLWTLSPTAISGEAGNGPRWRHSFSENSSASRFSQVRPGRKLCAFRNFCVGPACCSPRAGNPEAAPRQSLIFGPRLQSTVSG